MDKSVIFNLSYGLYILTAKGEEKDGGCVVNTVMQICDNPIVGVVSINKSNYTHDLVMETGKMNISILTEDVKMSIFERFGFQSGKNVNKFEGFESVDRAINGIYYLTDFTNGYISCEVVEHIDFISHTLFKIKMVDGQVFNNNKSVTYDYYHKNIKPKPASAGNLDSKGWVCKICGHILEEEEIQEDYICPICKHGASDFERI